MIEELLEKSDDFFILADEKGKILDCNNQCQKVTGYSKEELIQQNIKIIIPKHIAIEHDSFLLDFIKKKKNFDSCFGRNFRIICKDGSNKNIVMTVTSSWLDEKCFFLVLIKEAEKLNVDKNRNMSILDDILKKSDERALELTRNGT